MTGSVYIYDLSSKIEHTLISGVQVEKGGTVFVVSKNKTDSTSAIQSYRNLNEIANTENYIEYFSNTYNYIELFELYSNSENQEITTEFFTNTENYGYMGLYENDNVVDPINQNHVVQNYYLNDYVITPETPDDFYQYVEDVNTDAHIHTFTFDSMETLATGLLDFYDSDNFLSEKSIGEIIVYDKILPREDIKRIHAYLGHKWGIANTKILTEINKKYGDITYSIVDDCGGVQVFANDIYTYSLTLNHIVTNTEDIPFTLPVNGSTEPQVIADGTEFLEEYLANSPYRPDC